MLFAEPDDIKRSAVVGVVSLGFLAAHPAWLGFDSLVAKSITKDDVSGPTEFVFLLPLLHCTLVSGLAIWRR